MHCMKKIYNWLIIASFASIATASFAQNDTTLRQSMTVERDFSPIIRDANKIDQQPKREEIKVKKSATRYSDWLAPSAGNTLIDPMKAGQVVAEDNPYKMGFVEFSAGNYINADLKAGITYEEFSAELNGFLTKGNLDLPYQSLTTPYLSSDYDIQDAEVIPTLVKWKSRLLNGDIKLGYDHTFNNSSRVRAYVGASGRNYNMLDAYHVPAELSTNNIEDPLYIINGNNKQTKQKVGKLFANTVFDIADASFQLGFTHSGASLQNSSENVMNLSGKYGWYFENDWQAVAGLNVGMHFAEKNYFTIMPEVEYSKFSSDALFRYYINAKAGISRPDLYEVMTMMPFAINTWDYSTEKNIFDITAGYENNEDGSFKYGLYIGASMTLDRLDAVMTSGFSEEDEPFLEAPVFAELDKNLTFARLTRSDAFALKVGGYIDYEYNRFLNVKGGLDLNTNPRFGDSMINFESHILSNPISNLNFDLGLNCGFVRKMEFEGYYSKAESEKYLFNDNIDLGNILDLSFRADYAIKNNLRVFLYGKNLLNRDYQVFTCVPAQKINLHAGFNLLF